MPKKINLWHQSVVKPETSNIIQPTPGSGPQEIFQKLNISGIVTPTVGVIVPEIPPGAFATGESNTPLLLKLMKFGINGSPGW